MPCSLLEEFNPASVKVGGPIESEMPILIMIPALSRKIQIVIPP